MMGELRQAGVDPVFLCPEIGENLCTLLSAIIDPLYKSINPPTLLSAPPPPPPVPHPTPVSATLPTVSSFADFLPTVSTPLETLGSVALSSDPVLFTKLCRLFSHHLASNPDCTASLQPLLSSTILPTISMFKTNPAPSLELWEVLKLLPYERRYQLYDAWKGSSLERKAVGRDALAGKGTGASAKPLQRVATEVETGLDARYALKRLTKENAKEIGKR